MSINRKWAGFRELELVDKKDECEGIVSFYFKAKDNGKLIKHKAGQFLTIKIDNKDEKYKNQLRTYSLSMVPNENIYRISVKKIEGGLISSYLHDKLQVGENIEAMAPMGLFTIKNNKKNAVFISGGIGITPLLSMLYDESRARNNIHFIQAVQNSKMHPFKKDIQSIVEMRNIKSTVFYSNPISCDKEGIDYDYTGYVNKEFLIKNVDLTSDFYLCGPPMFMKIIEKTLMEIGVEEDCINYELFIK